jgi:hypothetical protein
LQDVQDVQDALVRRDKAGLPAIFWSDGVSSAQQICEFLSKLVDPCTELQYSVLECYAPPAAIEFDKTNQRRARAATRGRIEKMSKFARRKNLELWRPPERPSPPPPPPPLDGTAWLPRDELKRTFERITITGDVDRLEALLRALGEDQGTIEFDLMKRFGETYELFQECEVGPNFGVAAMTLDRRRRIQEGGTTCDRCGRVGHEPVAVSRVSKN